MKPSLSFLRSSLSLSRLLQTTTLGVILTGSSAQAVDYYKANNVTSLTSTGSWWADAAGTTASGSAPTSTTSSTAVCIWNNLVSDPNTTSTIPDVGMQTLRILDPGGLVTLDGSSTLNKTLSIANGGGIDMSNATQDLRILNLSTASDKGLRLAGTNAVMNINMGSGRTFTMESKMAVTNGASGGTVNFSGAGTSIFTAAFNPTNVNINGGEVRFNSISGTSRIGTSTTTVNGGRLVVNNTSGSATGAGQVNVKDTATLTGQGIMTGLVTVESGGTIMPKENAVGSLTAGSLTLAAGSKMKWESNGTTSDLINVTTSGGLTINGGTVELYNPGTTAPFSGIGTFNMISYTGSISGAGTASLAVAESSKIPGQTYTFGVTTGATNYVTIRVEIGTRPQSFWNVNANGTWATPANWTSNGVPNAVSAIANLGGIIGVPITAPRTVTLSADTTVGVLNIDSAQPFTLAGINTLTFDDGASAPTLHVESGSHTISAPLSFLLNGLLVDVKNVASTLTILGIVSSNDGGGFAKSGAGTLVLTADNGYAGNTSNGAGILQLGSGGSTGSVNGPISNNGTLRFNRSADYDQVYQISGPGALDIAGTGIISLKTSNTFSGPTTIAATGALVVADSLALQNSTLTYPAAGGTLTLSEYLGSVALGGLTGDKPFPLNDPLGNPVNLTIGSGNATTSYSGSSIGTGIAFTKTGTGTFSISGTHAFSAATIVGGGVFSLDTGSDFTTTTVTVGNSTGSNTGIKLRVNGGTLHSTGNSTLYNSAAGLEITGGTASFSGRISNVNANAADASDYFINVTGGTLNAGSMDLIRGNLSISTEPTSGQSNKSFYINGGTVNIAGALSVGAGNTNSSVSTKIDSGSLTVGGPLTIGINNLGRWSVLDISGGTFTSTDTSSGIRIGNAFAGQAIMLVRGGVAKAERIQFGQTDIAGTAILSQTAGSLLYVGSGGMVLGSNAITARLRLAGGTLGATADSTSDVPVSLTGTAVITGADALDSPHTVTFSGSVDGSGGLVKTGSGSVSFTSPSIAFSGNVSVATGTLGLGGSTGALEVDSTGTLIPRGTLSPQAASSIDGTLAIRYDVANSLLPGRVHSLGTLTLGAGCALNISGTGTLTAPVYILASGASGVTGTFTTVTGVPGGYTLSYTYNDGSGFPVVALVSSTATTPYSQWASSFSLTGDDAATSADPDFDGLKNLIEFALGTHPKQSSTGPVVGRSGSFLTLTFPHIAGGNLTYIVEAGDNLTTWATVATYPAYASAGTETYTDTVAIGSAPRRMLRLRIIVSN